MSGKFQGASTSDADPIVVFDIDGVLSDPSHRLHHMEKSPRDWKSFFGAAARDPVKAEVLAQLLTESESARIILMTGRPVSMRDVTRRWLDQAGIPDFPVLFRASTDHRPAKDVKEEMLSDLGGPSVVVRLYEDDQDVVQHLRALGYSVIEVG
jgi:phosphoglycolate phosphatase-like HAD superfamily hydrolase